MGRGGFASWSHAPKPGFWNWNFQHNLECSVFALVWNSAPVWKDKSLWSELEGGWCHWIKPRTPSCSCLGTVTLGEILQLIQQGSLPPKMPSFAHLRNISWALFVPCVSTRHTVRKLGHVHCVKGSIISEVRQSDQKYKPQTDQIVATMQNLLKTCKGSHILWLQAVNQDWFKPFRATPLSFCQALISQPLLHLGWPFTSINEI